MSALPASARARRLEPGEAGRLTALLESGFGGTSDALAHLFLLDALDRREFPRFVVWPPDDPVGVIYLGAAGSVLAAGDPAAGPALAGEVERADWRVLLGDAAPCQAILDANSKGLFRRRHSVREQRFMATTVPSGRPSMDGLRRANAGDLAQVTDFACRLHVEDRMGPPLSRPGRTAVRSRMRDSIAAGATWVVERRGRAVAKIDLPLESRRRGAQLAGVYVEEAWRGRGIASAAVGALLSFLLTEGGLPAVCLHVRADNESAQRAYRRAGLTDRGSWLLALR